MQHTRIALFMSALMITTSAGALPVPDASVPFAPVASVYQEDFELGEGGWTAGGSASSWAFGTPTGVSSPQGAYSGLNAWGTNLAGLYNNLECSYIQSPAIEIPAASPGSDADGAATVARLGFKHWMVSENRYDGGVVQVSLDGDAWTVVAPPGGYPVDLLTTARRCLLNDPSSSPPPLKGFSNTMSETPSSWLDAEVDLTAYLGQTIFVRFAFATDSSVTKAGWFIDDVVIQVGAGLFASADAPAVGGTSTPFTPLSTLYAEDFELGEGGWSASGSASSWAFGTPTGVGPSSPASGVNVWGTNLAGNYNPSECSRLTSGDITLPAAGADLPDGASVEVARLAFKQWFAAESRYDGGLLQVSTDGGDTWATVPMASYGNTANTASRACQSMSTTDLFQTGTLSTKPDEWLDGSADLTPYLGQTIRLRFQFSSDPSVHYAGWYIDDVAIVAGAGASVTPPALPTGPDGNVTIPFTEIATAYAEGFEGGVGGWTFEQRRVDTRIYTNTWQHGLPTATANGPVSLSGNVWGTNLSGNYLNNECAAITSPAMHIPANATATLGWTYWMRTENSFDAGVVEVSTDGGSSWSIVNPTVAYPRSLNTAARQCFHSVFSSTPPLQSGYSGSLSATSTSWLAGAADLSAFAGNDVLVRFHFATDTSVNSYAGWFIDNVNLVVDGSPAQLFDFESGTQGWSAATTPIKKPLTWEVGSPANVGPAAAASGANALGTNIDGLYSDGECSAAVSPVVDLTDSTWSALGATASLSMSQWFDSAGTGDAGLVQWSLDGGAWTTLVPVGGYPSSTLSFAYGLCFGTGVGTKAFANAVDVNWTTRTYNLTDAIGHSAQFRLLWAADNSTVDAGWYVDDFEVVVGVGGSGLPDAPAPPAATFGGAIDERLAEALAFRGPHADDKFLKIVIGGDALAQPEPTDDRAFAMAFYEAQAAEWIGAVDAYVSDAGGIVSSRFAIAPAVVALLPRDAVLGLLDVPGTKVLVLDDESSVRLIDPVPCDACEGDDGFGAQNEQSVPMTQAPDIWALGYRGEGLKIAIIDTGIDGTHEIIKDAGCNSRIVAWRDFVSNQLVPYDDHGHGTHVTGTAAGSTQCGGRADGVAPRASIMGVKFLNSAGSGSFENGIAALQWSFDNGADVTSNSWGSTSCTASIPTLQAVNNLARAGMVSAFAAGNSGPSSNTIGGPGCADLAVTVGSTDKALVVSSFSSRGPCSDPTEGGVSRICPDIMAVGSGVVSSVPRGSCSLCNPTGYRLLNGTSMATPHVGGALILMEQFKVALTGTGWDTANKAQETALKLTAMDLGSGGEDNTYGAGFIQLLPIYNLLANPGVPDVRSLFSAPSGELRVGQSAPMSFRVSNAGTRAVDGQFTVTLTTPDGPVTLDDRAVHIDFGGAASHASSFVVSAATAAGAYSYTGSFSYSWVDDEDVVHTGEILQTASWVVKKIDVRISRSIPATTSLGVPFDVVLTIENRGNEDALNLTTEETIRDSYVLVPGSPDPFNTNWIYGGSPAPGEVRHDTTFGRWTLVWDVGDFPAGSTTTITYSAVATKQGTFPFIGVAKYKNGLGQPFIQGFTSAQSVTALPPTPAVPSV